MRVLSESIGLIHSGCAECFVGHETVEHLEAATKSTNRTTRGPSSAPAASPWKVSPRSAMIPRQPAHPGSLFNPAPVGDRGPRRSSTTPGDTTGSDQALSISMSRPLLPRYPSGAGAAAAADQGLRKFLELDDHPEMIRGRAARFFHRGIPRLQHLDRGTAPLPARCMWIRRPDLISRRFGPGRLDQGSRSGSGPIVMDGRSPVSVEAARHATARATRSSSHAKIVGASKLSASWSTHLPNVRRVTKRADSASSASAAACA